MDREDIYQSEDYRYYVNHRDSSKNIYLNNNYPGTSYSQPWKHRLDLQKSTEVLTAHTEED